LPCWRQSSSSARLSTNCQAMHCRCPIQKLAGLRRQQEATAIQAAQLSIDAPVDTTLCHYNLMPLQPYATTTLCHYNLMPLRFRFRGLDIESFLPRFAIRSAGENAIQSRSARIARDCLPQCLAFKRLRTFCQCNGCYSPSL
jgi:hypothetical protein